MQLTPGMKTTEFWIGLLLPVILILFGKKLGITLSTEELYAVVGASGAYSVSRGISKVVSAKTPAKP